MGYNRLIKIYPNPADPGQYMMMVAVHPSSYEQAEKDNAPVCWRYKRIAFTHESRYLPGECPQPSNNELFRAITNTQNAVIEAAKRARAEMAAYDNQMRSPEYQAVSKNMDANADKVVALINQADERLAAGDKEGHDELTARANALEMDNEANHKEWLAPTDQRLEASEKNIAFCDLTSDLYEIKSVLMGNRCYVAPTHVNQNDADWYTRDLNPKVEACDEVWIESALVQGSRVERLEQSNNNRLGVTFSEYLATRVEQAKDDLKKARAETYEMLKEAGKKSPGKYIEMPNVEYIEEPYSHKYSMNARADIWEDEILKHAQYELYQESLSPENRDPLYLSDKDRYLGAKGEEIKERLLPLGVPDQFFFNHVPNSGATNAPAEPTQLIDVKKETKLNYFDKGFVPEFIRKVEAEKASLAAEKERLTRLAHNTGNCVAPLKPVKCPYSHKYMVMGGNSEYWERQVLLHAQYEFYQESLSPENREPEYISDADDFIGHNPTLAYQIRPSLAKKATSELMSAKPELAKAGEVHLHVQNIDQLQQAWENMVDKLSAPGPDTLEIDLTGPDDLTQEEMDYIDQTCSPDAQADETGSVTDLDSDQGEVYDGSDSEPEPEVKSKPINMVSILPPAQDPTLEPFQYLTASTDGGWKTVTGYTKKTV